MNPVCGTRLIDLPILTMSFTNCCVLKNLILLYLQLNAKNEISHFLVILLVVKKLEIRSVSVGAPTRTPGAG